MILINDQGKRIKLTLESYDETTELSYVSEFDMSKRMNITIQPVITGNDIPILTITISNDAQILVNKENDRYFMIAPDINTEGWDKLA